MNTERNLNPYYVQTYIAFKQSLKTVISVFCLEWKKFLKILATSLYLSYYVVGVQKTQLFFTQK